MCAIYDFQTLITGGIAIAVAISAGIPVWRQLKDSNLQTRISHRETLVALQRNALTRFAKVKKTLEEPLQLAGRLSSDYDGEALAIKAEDAHHLEQIFSGILDWYLVTLANTEEDPIEKCKRKLKLEIDALVQTLGDAHWADHNDQHDEERSIPDDEWADLVKRCADAKLEAYSRVTSVSVAYNALVVAQEDVVRSLRVRIATRDKEIKSS